MTEKSPLKYLFGPVNSRRLGRSLGIDLVNPKTCSLNCVYCQAGPTTVATIDRSEYVPTAAVIKELEQWLRANDPIDAITFSGFGEPTLHSGIGEVIRAAKKLAGVPVVVITNGTLLYIEAVRADLGEADIVMPSLDSFDAESFEEVNKPAPGLDFQTYISGLIRFSEEFHGRLLLEIFFVKGLNDSNESARKLGEIAEKIRADEINLNTAVRPVPAGGVEVVPPERMAELCGMFGEKAVVIGGAGE